MIQERRTEPMPFLKYRKRAVKMPPIWAAFLMPRSLPHPGLFFRTEIGVVPVPVGPVVFIVILSYDFRGEYRCLTDKATIHPLASGMCRKQARRRPCPVATSPLHSARNRENGSDGQPLMQWDPLGNFHRPAADPDRIRRLADQVKGRGKSSRAAKSV